MDRRLADPRTGGVARRHCTSAWHGRPRRRRQPHDAGARDDTATARDAQRLGLAHARERRAARPSEQMGRSLRCGLRLGGPTLADPARFAPAAPMWPSPSAIAARRRRPPHARGRRVRCRLGRERRAGGVRTCRSGSPRGKGCSDVHLYRRRVRHCARDTVDALQSFTPMLAILPAPRDQYSRLFRS